MERPLVRVGAAVHHGDQDGCLRDHRCAVPRNRLTPVSRSEMTGERHPIAQTRERSGMHHEARTTAPSGFMVRTSLDLRSPGGGEALMAHREYRTIRSLFAFTVEKDTAPYRQRLTAGRDREPGGPTIVTRS
jgi:hypothetical protein